MFSVLFLMLDEIFTSFTSAGEEIVIVETTRMTLSEMLNQLVDKILSPAFLISIAILLFYFLIIAPFNMGKSWWYYSLTANGNIQVGNVLSFYKTNTFYSACIGFELSLFLRKLAYGIGCLFPSFVALFMAFERKGGEYVLMSEGTEVPLFAAAGLAVAGIIVYIYFILGLFLSRYLFAIGECPTAKEAFSYSKEIMHGDRSVVVGMVASLIGWYISCLLLLPALYAVPLIDACLARTAREIIDKQKKRDLLRTDKFIDNE